MLEGLHERGFDDLIPAHLNVLQYPGPEATRPSELAARIRMSKQALNYLLGQLEQFGYLVRQDDDADQRGKRIMLTRRGIQAVEAIREIVAEVENDWERQLGPEAFAQLRDLLHRLRAIADLPAETKTGTPTMSGQA
jgi:DNA-binding MarR family transcriptional regulator